MCNRSVCFYKNKIPGCVTRGKACPLPVSFSRVTGIKRDVFELELLKHSLRAANMLLYESTDLDTFDVSQTDLIFIRRAFELRNSCVGPFTGFSVSARDGRDGSDRVDRGDIVTARV